MKAAKDIGTEEGSIKSLIRKLDGYSIFVEVVFNGIFTTAAQMKDKSENKEHKKKTTVKL